ncbi:hypothetical protein KUTeg_004203 [Tegillarca granosa]|uniref:Methylcytosine dioxygenase TET n=1 Tax=Tegillarca granosa TaxID=220873 RepID=A0ABQ9FR31_TEGGR|nr:hypothetical protein KUTeg_004203 [Tegillarca granosa]
MMEKRTGVTGKALRLEKIRYTGKEGKSSRGCPIAKWIIRRSGPEEKYLCVVRHRQGHYCETACIVIVIVAWEGIEKDTANDMYSYLVSNITTNGFETERRCGTNERQVKRTCACQGADLNKRGASFSFGCSWSMYFNGCKFARSREVRKFKLKDTSQIQFDEVAKACRLGNESGRPFSGVTACVDFCAHAHKDLHNMNNGSTVVVTLTKHRGLDKPQDEQLHVLPMYVMDLADDNGSMEAMYDQIRSGALEVLQQYPLEARIRSEPLTPCKKRGKQKKAGKESPASKKGSPVTPKNKVSASPQGKLKESSTYQNHSASDLYFNHKSSDKNFNSDKTSQPSKLVNNDKGYQDQQLENKKRVMSYDDMAVSDKMNNQALYESFWNYFNCFGTFPPSSFINSWAVQRKGFTAPNSDTLPENISGKYDNTNSSLHSNKHEPSSSNKEDILTQESSSTSQKSLFQQSGDIHFNGALNKSGRESSQNQEKQKEIVGEVPLDLSSSGSSLDLKSSFDLMNGQKDSMKAEANKSSDSRSNGSMVTNNGREGTAEGFQSPLHLLSEAVFLRTKDANEENRQQNNFSENPSDLPQTGNTMPNNYMNSLNNVVNINGHPPFNAPFTNNIANAEETSLDPTVVKCELEYNKEAFLDQEMGGVAIALQHGAVLFEVAKRELHATTGLRNPNRFAPTRISLVFYQHKNLNRASHGWFEYEQKLQMLKQSRLEKMNDKNSILPALDLPQPPPLELLRKKKKGKKSDKDSSKEDLEKMPSVEYKYLWEGPLRRAVSLTTDSVITRWIDPQPMVTGPYQRWV